MTTLPLPERSGTPSSDAGQPAEADGSRGRSAVLEQPAELSVVPDLSVHRGLSISAVPEQPAVGHHLEPSDRDAFDTALLTGVTRVAGSVELLVGAWLTFSPWLVGSNGSSALRWSNVVVGVLLVALGALRLSRPATPRGPALSFGLGAWTIIAAFVLSFQNGATGTAPLWSAIACGAVLTGAAAWATTEAERAGLHQV